MGEAVTSASVESTKAALEESRELAKVMTNEKQWFDDSVKSIEIKEAYKKVQVQITEEYQLVEDDPTTLGIDVQKSEHGEVAVIVRGKVLDDEEVALLQMKKTHTQIGGITTESTEVHMSKPLDADTEALPLPPPPPSEPPALPPAEEKKEPENEEKAPPVEPPPPAPEVSPPAPEVSPPAPEVPAENKAAEGELKDLNLESTIPTPPPPNLSLKGEYKPEEKEPQDNAYELLIGKISWVPPPERPINKCYFYKPKEGEKKSTKWPPKSNVSTIIVKPRVRRADEVDRPRGTTPKPRTSTSQQKSTDVPKSMPEAPQSTPQQIPTEQVSGSQLQEASKTDSVPTSGSNEIKPTEGESQVTESSEPAPQPPAGGEVVEPPKEGAAVEAPTQETPASQETPAPQETPVSQETPAAQENSAPQETPVQQETPASQETSAPQETPTEQSADSAPPPTA